MQEPHTTMSPIPSVPATPPSSQTSEKPIDYELQSPEHEDECQDHKIAPLWLISLHHSEYRKHAPSRQKGCRQSIGRGTAAL